MSKFNLPIVVTGCQRSGTTLLLLVFNAHPAVRGVDETLFDPKLLQIYLQSQEYSPAVCFKLPVIAHEAKYFAAFPGVKILWALRDPRDVVTSMVRLEFDHAGIKAPFAAHSKAGPRLQIRLLERALGDLPVDLRRELEDFHAHDSIPPVERSLDLNVTAAALCWRLKQEAFRLYEDKPVDLRVVRYERLVAEPRSEVEALISFTGLPWDERVMQHHRFHKGKVTGDTDSDRPIDRKSLGKWQEVLGPAQLEIIGRICGDEARKCGYGL
ncbi:MAG TPA: sulfotransferase [Gammaproteobacteria bacterium]|nr:sulfotransferase [Gammaproteobacteria bacterium]